MKAPTTEQMIARRVRGGANPDQSRALLVEHLNLAGPGSLAYVLHYDGFATERQADAFAAAYFA